MSEAIFAALISGSLSLLGVIITCLLTARKSENALKIAQAVTDTKIEALTRAVREHNDFTRRMPVVEEQICCVTAEIRDLKRSHTPIQ